MTEVQKKRNIIVGIIIVIAGIIVMVTLIKIKKAPPRQPAVNKGILVETVLVEKGPETVTVAATGEATASRKTDIIPQVSGKVSLLSKKMKRGSFFRTGDLLYQIDTADYRLDAEKAKAQVAKSENDLLETEGLADVALKEWEISQQFRAEKATAPPLVLYEPQLKRARASLASAKADHKRTLLNIERTKLTAPFNCIIVGEDIEQGKYVTAGSHTIEILGTDSFDVAVPLPYSETALLSVPDASGKTDGSPGIITLQSGDLEFRWKIVVAGQLGRIDKGTYMPTILLSVPDPYNLSGTHGEKTPALAEGLFVKALLQGKRYEDIYAVSTVGLRDNDTVWIFNEDKTLSVRGVTVLRRERDRVLISDGLVPGDEVIISSVSGAAEGMKLRKK